MTHKILLGASLIAVMAAFPALAETEAKAGAEASTGVKIENTLEKAGHEIEKAADTAATKTKGAYNDVKAYFTNDNDIKAVSSFNVDTALTADKLIGTSIQNPKGEKIGKIEDIIVNADGDATAVVVNDGGVLGLGGKMAAFDYDILEGFTANENVMVKLSEDSIKNAQAYDPDAMAAGSFSTKKLADAKIVDANGKAVADVETIAFDGDDADYVVAKFNDILGMGGDKVAMDFDALTLTNASGKYTFKLNAQQSAQFEAKKGATKAN